MTVACVAGLAVVAGTISFAHMHELATEHDQHGWKAFAFPISVGGLEIVAALYMVVQRRAGRRAGWLPWVALVVGTAASLAANIAVGGESVIGKILAGWPALSMLIAVKLLFSMIDHGEDDPRTVPDDLRTSADRPLVPEALPQIGPDSGPPVGPTLDGRTGHPGRSATSGTGRGVGRVSGRSSGPATAPVPVDVQPVAHLLPAARAAVREALAATGRPPSRDRLADALRDDGHGVSNERASLLLKILKAEQDVPTIGAGSVRPWPDDLDTQPEVAAQPSR
ncbi:DUF2637 domain-containing protein [Solwaraspora sp. WMMD406]|uniref:DUF2637 domain-containing protein n=1 Tax=Solwaraspora sp. WMMD406 TaxID=3016095 RepID=UPI0024176ACF|nr:DUF2637 domain-containing protein [Solwaraspora sp. WMMD406]MDG4763334.1 DUF2637 domain-containing protein [Solwaraspora sp. WMMD406]